jgi:predicted nucleotide-binding protein
VLDAGFFFTARAKSITFAERGERMADLFISYARGDAPIVYPILEELKQHGLSIWYDAANLLAGESWARAIAEALRQAEAVVTFVSGRPSDWVFKELLYALENQIRVIPVLLPGGSPDSLPPELRRYQFIDLSSESIADLAPIAASRIETAFRRLKATDDHRPLRSDEIAGFTQAASIQATERDATAKDHPTSIFVVHGHDEEMLSDIREFVRSHGIEPIVLRDMDSGASSLLDRFFEVGGEATDAIVLLSGDDYGASVKQYDHEDVADRALQFRARQNVILELGYFYGLLGWDKVYVLERAPTRPFPNFERPSDLDGKVFNRFDAGGVWKAKLTRHLRQSGFAI